MYIVHVRCEIFRLYMNKRAGCFVLFFSNVGVSTHLTGAILSSSVCTSSVVGVFGSLWRLIYGLGFMHICQNKMYSYVDDMYSCAMVWSKLYLFIFY